MSDSEKENMEKVEGRRVRNSHKEKEGDEDTSDSKDGWTTIWISSPPSLLVDFLFLSFCNWFCVERKKKIEWTFPDVFKNVEERPFP